MITKVMEMVARWTVGSKLLGVIAWVHDALDGRRSEILLGILALVHVLKVVGLVPPEVAATIETALSTLLPVTLMDRASKVMGSVDSVLGK